MKPIMVSIGNPKTFIQMQCSKGIKLQSYCRQVYNGTIAYVIMEISVLAEIYAPVLLCTIHDEITRIYGWRNEQEHGKIGRYDILINKQKWWTLNKWKTVEDRKRWHLDKKYHFSYLLFCDFVKSHVINS